LVLSCMIVHILEITGYCLNLLPKYLNNCLWRSTRTWSVTGFASKKRSIQKQFQDSSTPGQLFWCPLHLIHLLLWDGYRDQKLTVLCCQGVKRTWLKILPGISDVKKIDTISFKIDLKVRFLSREQEIGSTIQRSTAIARFQRDEHPLKETGSLMSGSTSGPKGPGKISCFVDIRAYQDYRMIWNHTTPRIGGGLLIPGRLYPDHSVIVPMFWNNGWKK
jgi:hypothetical protein